MSPVDFKDQCDVITLEGCDSHDVLSPRAPLRENIFRRSLRSLNPFGDKATCSKLPYVGWVNAVA